MTTPRKERKREARREQKAEQAAVLDKVVLFSFSHLLPLYFFVLNIFVFLLLMSFTVLQSIEKELLERLKRGVYPGEIVNIIPVAKYNEILDKEAIVEEEDEDEEVLLTCLQI